MVTVKAVLRLCIVYVTSAACNSGGLVNDAKASELPAHGHVKPRISRADEEAVKAELGKQLLDPYSAHWAFEREVSEGGVKKFCGHVNAKNSFGAYTGRRVFVAAIAPGGEVAFAQISDEGVGNLDQSFLALCNPH